MHARWFGVGAVMTMALAGMLSAQAGHGGTAVATLHDAQGRTVGHADLRETPNGVLITLNLRRAPAGVHAFHIHTTGRCDRPGFESAGSHFDPTQRPHGLLSPGGPHAGDLPNVHVPDGGAVTVEMLAPNVVLKAAPRSLFDADGSAIVLHSGADDYISEPAGDAGTRVACGVVTRPGSD